MDKQWIVVVGRPNLNAWGGDTHLLDMKNVGQPVDEVDFATRKEAREYAKKCGEGNVFWTFRSKRRGDEVNLSR